MLNTDADAGHSQQPVLLRLGRTILALVADGDVLLIDPGHVNSGVERPNQADVVWVQFRAEVQKH